MLKRRPPIYFMIALCCALTVWIVTSQHGIGYSPDAFSYLSGAYELKTGGIFVRSYHLSHFPPGQSIILLLPNNNIDRLLIFNMALLAFNVFVFALMLHLANIKHTLLLMVLVAVGIAPEMVFRHASIASEPLFLLLVNLTLMMLAAERFSMGGDFCLTCTYTTVCWGLFGCRLCDPPHLRATYPNMESLTLRYWYDVSHWHLDAT